MKILHTADLHIGKTLEGQSREAEQQQVLAEIAEIIQENKVDLLLIAGDIFDTYNPSAEAEGLYYDFLEEVTKTKGCGVVLIAGNHDQPKRLGAAAPLALRNSIYILANPNTVIPLQSTKANPQVVASGPNWLELAWQEETKPNAVIAALPYVSEGRIGQLISPNLSDDDQSNLAYSRCVQGLFQEAGANFRQDTVNLAMAHAFAVGGKTSDTERSIQVGGSFGVRADAFPAMAQYVALGHLHRKQQIKSDTTCYYSGSPLACGFGEANQSKVVILAEITPNHKPKITEIPLTTGYPLHEAEFNSYQAAIDWCENTANHHNWLNIKLCLNQPLNENEIKALRSAHPRLLRIEVDLQGITPQEQTSLKSLTPAERFKLFVCKKTDAEPTQALTELFLQLTQSEEVPEVEFSQSLTNPIPAPSLPNLANYPKEEK